MRKLILYLGSLFLFFSVSAQNLTIKRIELAGEKVLIFYDLDDGNSSHEYLLNLYSSRDNFAAPLAKVTGDVGSEIKPGIDKKIEWSIREEFGGFKGRISLEIRGKVFVPVVKLQNFDASKSYKRGKHYDITWKSGSTNAVNIELLEGNQRIQGDMTQPNNGAYTFYIPASIKPGKDYRLRFTDSKVPDEVIFTPYFKITPQIPTILKIAVPVVVVAVAVVVLGGTGGGGGSGGSSDGVIPDPSVPAN
jgi:Ser-Thr-rich glycosyl-phosphatidyl-inositol-anchored membrane family